MLKMTTLRYQKKKKKLNYEPHLFGGGERKKDEN